MADDFPTYEPVQVRYAGKDWPVSPLTTGQARRLRTALAHVPRPEPIPIEVKGLLEALTQPADTPGGGNGMPAPINAGQIANRIMRGERDREKLIEAVAQMVREERQRVASWPPDVTNPDNAQVLFEDERLWVDTVAVILNVDRGEAERLVDIAAVHEYANLLDAAYKALVDRIIDRNLEAWHDPKQIEMRAALEEQARRKAAANSSDAGGEPARSVLRPSSRAST